MMTVPSRLELEMGIRYRIAERALVSAFDVDESNRKAFVARLNYFFGAKEFPRV